MALGECRQKPINKIDFIRKYRYYLIRELKIETQMKECSVRTYRKRYQIVIAFALVGLLLFSSGCGNYISIAGEQIALDCARLDLNGKNLTTVSKLKRLDQLQFLDLRNNNISVKQYRELQESLPACKVVWSVPLDSMRFDSDSTSIVYPDIAIKNASLLKYLPELRTIDASGNQDYNALQELAKQYPQYLFKWEVCLGDQTWTNDTKCITVNMNPIDKNLAESAFSGFLDLQYVDLTNTDISIESVSAWEKQFPEIGFRYHILLADLTIDSDTQSLVLRDMDSISMADLETVIPRLSLLKSVDLRGCNLPIQDKKTLQLEYPQLEFLWTIEVLPGIQANSTDQEIILSNNTVTDLNDLTEKLALLPGLKIVEMCSCGLSDDQMQSLREQFPEKKFIWLIRVGEWELRTDVRAFSMANVKDFPGGQLVGDEYWRYSRFTADSLSSLKYCTDLIALDIGHASNVLDLFSLAGLNKLQYLIVAMTKAQDIEVVRDMPDLVFLEIFSMPISDLSPLLACKKLEYLNCGNCNFNSIDTLVQLTTLKRLWLINSDLKDEQIAELRAALPNTIIKTGGDHPTDNGWRSGSEGYHTMQELFHLGHF